MREFRSRLAFITIGYDMVGELHLRSLGHKLWGSVAWSNRQKSKSSMRSLSKSSKFVARVVKILNTCPQDTSRADKKTVPKRTIFVWATVLEKASLKFTS